MPSEYVGQVKISDEWAEMDLNIGLSELSKLVATEESAFNDPTVYQKLLSTDDFAKEVNIPSDRIAYQVDAEQGTLVIQVTDNDAVKAARLADSVAAHLQLQITKLRSQRSVANLANAKQAYNTALHEYRDAQERLNTFVESHNDTKSYEDATELESLSKEKQRRYNVLQKALETYTRETALSNKSIPSFSTVKRSTVSHAKSSPKIEIILATYIILALILATWTNLWREKAKTPERLSLDFGTLFSPWSITFFIWVLITSCVWLEGDRLYPLTSQYYISIVLWLTTFCFTSIVTYNLMDSTDNPREESIKTKDICNGVFNLFFTLSMILTPLYVLEVYKVVSQFNAADMLSNIRTFAVHGEALGWLKYTFVINQAIFLVGVWQYPKISKLKLTAIYISNITCALAIMEKGSFFMLIICSLFVLYEKRLVKARTIAACGFGIVALFFAFNLFRDTEDGEIRDTEFLDFFAMYVTSPPVAFCQLQRDLTQQIGTNTFQVIYNFLERFNIGDYVVEERNQPFIMVPVITNIYTVMQPFYQDFGHGGVAFFGTIYGLLTGFIYRLYRNGNTTARVFYTYMVQILVLQFYQEYLFMMLSAIVQLCLIITFITQQKIKISLLRLKW